MGWRGRRSADDLEEEFRAHLAHEADAFEAGGMAKEEAMAAARTRFGDFSRAMPPRSRRLVPGYGLHLARHLSQALRTLRHQPGFAIVATLTLAVGIGMNSAIFTFMYSLTIRGLPLPDPDRLVTVHQIFDGVALDGFGEASMTVAGETRRAFGSSDRVSWSEFRSYRDGARNGIDLAGFSDLGATLAGVPAQPVRAMAVTCGYFRVLQVPLDFGRAFDPDDCRAAGEAPVVVLSHDLWQSRFGGDGGVIGTTVRLDRTSFTVVGVVAPGFTGTDTKRPDLWIPATMQPALGADRLGDENLGWLALIGRLRPGSSPAGVAAQLTTLGRGRDTAHPGRHTTVLVYDATRVGGPVLAPYVRIAQACALGLAALILLIACLNVASLLLARAPARQREVRIRRALGASRADVVGKLLAESGVLALAGGALGLVLAYQLPTQIAARLLPARLGVPLTPDPTILAYALLVSCVSVLVFGVMPALETSRVHLASALRGDAAGAGRSGRRTFRLRQLVVAGQMAGSLLMLVLAALFVRTVSRAQHADPGFRVDHVYGFSADLAGRGYGPAEASEFYQALLDRVAALPGVQSTALASQFPLRGTASANFVSAPEATEGAGDESEVFFVDVSPGYLTTLVIPVLRGRGLPPAPTGPGEPRPAVIGERMAQRFWPDRDPIGEIFAAPPGQTRRVVGIARDALVTGLETADRPFFYSALPAATSPGVLVVRTGARGAVTADVVRVAHELDPAVLVTAISLHDLFQSKLEPARVAALTAGGIGALAFLLAIVGVYGVVAFVGSQRAFEFGVRAALGADRRTIRFLVLRQGAPPVIGGLVGGALVAAAIAQLLRGRLYGFSALDPVAFVGATALLGAAAVAAMLRPALRAASVDPARTLRQD